MKKLLFLIAGISTIAAAEDVRDSDRIVCATQEVILCVEHGDCFNLIPDDLSIPDFLVIDLKEKTLSTTDASPNPRTSEIDNRFRLCNLREFELTSLGERSDSKDERGTDPGDQRLCTL